MSRKCMRAGPREVLVVPEHDARQEEEVALCRRDSAACEEEAHEIAAVGDVVVRSEIEGGVFRDAHGHVARKALHLLELIFTRRVVHEFERQHARPERVAITPVACLGHAVELPVERVAEHLDATEVEKAEAAVWKHSVVARVWVRVEHAAAVELVPK